MLYMYILLAMSGIFFIAFSFVITTQNLISSILFKVMPFFFGLLHLFIAAKNMGMLN